MGTGEFINESRSRFTQRREICIGPAPVHARSAKPYKTEVIGAQPYPAPNLEEMLSFTQRYRAIAGYTLPASSSHVTVKAVFH